MSTRRTRIKGIANIPPRKKAPDSSSVSSKDEETSNAINNTSTENSELIQEIQNLSTPVPVPVNINASLKNDQISNNSEIENIDIETKRQIENSTSSITRSETDNNDKQKENNFDGNQKNPVTTTLSRRKILKPMVSVTAVNKKVKVSTSDSQDTQLLDNNAIEHEVNAENEENKTDESQILSEEARSSKSVPIRRKFIKSAVSVGILNQKPRISKVEQHIESNKINSDDNLNLTESTSDKCIPNTSRTSIVLKNTNHSDNLEVSTIKDLAGGKDIETSQSSKEANILDNSVISGNSILNNVSTVSQEEPKISNSNDVNNSKEPLISRRKFIKPSISLSALAKKPKLNALLIEPKNVVDDKQTENQASKNFSDIKESIENSFNTLKNESQVVGIERLDANEEENQTTLDEVDLTPSKITSLVEGNTLKKPITIITGTQSDIDYPPPPPSPSKINRSRIKAVPRLNYRKASFSASESEDEARRGSYRIRNDSVCSATSGIAESITECSSPQKSREINSIIQKKCNRTEQTRKLLEARKEFQKRFGANKPDRQQLTMMDLIFYNPDSNPIIEQTETKIKFDKVEKEEEKEVESEKIDDPVKENSEKSEEENDIPGPQVKIGPSGEIILDEKSLVIERKELKKKQEELQRSEVVDGDFDRGYGIYKKHKRSKKWSPNETLRFYKALNTIGTDFTLMLEFFPNRTRREIKMKFKKEEKINQLLIDRALLQPCNFDFGELQNEIDTEQKENEEMERQKLEKIKMKEKKKLEKPKKRKFSVVEKMNIIEKVPKRKKKRKRTKIRMNESDADESDLQTQSESDDELVLQHQPTRSGRLPKVPEKFQAEDVPISAESINVIRKPIKTSQEKEDESDGNKDTVPSEPVQIEPGSIMIMCEKGTSGEPVYKIFMITPQQAATPVNLAPDAIAKAIEFKKGIGAENIITISANNTDDEDALPEENNYTIPADENVTTLRSNPVTDDETDYARNYNKEKEPEYILPDAYNSDLDNETNESCKIISVTDDEDENVEMNNPNLIMEEEFSYTKNQ